MEFIVKKKIYLVQIQLIIGKFETFYCQKKIFFFVERCKTIQTVCTSSTCSNNGTCFIDSSSGNSTTRCLCSQNYTGQYCDIPLLLTNSCSQNPCGFNGTCIQPSNSSYYCICPNGLTGQSCNSSKYIL